MSQQGNNKSKLRAVLSLEGLLCLVGILLIVSWTVTGQVLQLFWGGTIVCGSVALYFVKRKDWKKHWEEQELFRQAYQERQRREKERDDHSN